MREFSTNVQDALERDPVRVFYLVQLSLGSTYRYTSFPSDIVFDGNTYTSDGGLVSLSTYRNSSVIDRAAYKVVFSDQDEVLRGEIKSSNVIGSPISVKVGFLDEYGVPMLDMEDVIDVYTGTIDKPSLSNNHEELLVSIEGSSPMDALDAVNSFIVSRDGMDQANTNDTSFDSVYEDLEVELKWGKV